MFKNMHCLYSSKLRYKHKRKEPSNCFSRNLNDSKVELYTEVDTDAFTAQKYASVGPINLLILCSMCMKMFKAAAMRINLQNLALTVKKFTKIVPDWRLQSVIL